MGNEIREASVSSVASHVMSPSFFGSEKSSCNDDFDELALKDNEPVDPPENVVSFCAAGCSFHCEFFCGSFLMFLRLWVLGCL